MKLLDANVLLYAVNTDASAALSLEHRCGVVSFDNDFSRFPGGGVG